jgi:hypothetical protein
MIVKKQFCFWRQMFSQIRAMLLSQNDLLRQQRSVADLPVTVSSNEAQRILI